MKQRPENGTMNKKQSKYFNTAERMDRALLELLEKKDFEYITVKELCERAEVNRSTFYLHYENTADLLTETTRFVLDSFLSYFESSDVSPVTDLAACDKDQLIFMRREYILPYLAYVRENRRIFRTALKHLGTMGFEAYYEQMYRGIFDPILARFGAPESYRPYMMKFYLTGFTAVSMEWLKRDCSEPAEVICEVILSCVPSYEDSTKA